MHALALAAGLTGFAAVAFGAFGAHAARDVLTDEAMGWWTTATLYALVHGASALGLALHGHGKTILLTAGWVFVAGTALFSGSLYAMALGAPRALAMATPVGGGLFLAGWALIFVYGVRRR